VLSSAETGGDRGHGRCFAQANLDRGLRTGAAAESVDVSDAQWSQFVEAHVWASCGSRSVTIDPASPDELVTVLGVTDNSTRYLDK
jgi:hypothetical protein